MLQRGRDGVPPCWGDMQPWVYTCHLGCSGGKVWEGFYEKRQCVSLWQILDPVNDLGDQSHGIRKCKENVIGAVRHLVDHCGKHIRVDVSLVGSCMVFLMLDPDQDSRYINVWHTNRKFRKTVPEIDGQSLRSLKSSPSGAVPVIV